LGSVLQISTCKYRKFYLASILRQQVIFSSIFFANFRQFGLENKPAGRDRFETICPVPPLFQDRIRALAISNNNKYFALTANDIFIHFYEAQTRS
jgi:hypothetical protein